MDSKQKTTATGEEAGVVEVATEKLAESNCDIRLGPSATQEYVDCVTFPCLCDDGGVASETTAPAKVLNAAERQTDDIHGEKLPDAADDDTAAPETAASEEQQHSQQSLCNNTTTDAETGTATIGGDGVSITVEAPSEYFQHSDRAVFGIIIATFLMMMGIVVFIVLGGGKVGLYMTIGLISVTFTGSTDIAMKITHNLDADDFDTGYAIGGMMSFQNDNHPWRVGYTYQDLEADATFGLFSDSDFIGGGTDGKGHIIRGNYSLTKAIALGGTLFVNERGGNAGESEDYNRLMLDIAFKY